MDINLTLFGEMLTFAVLVWVMMKYIWPPLMTVIQERQQKIAAGLEAAERGKHELSLAHTNIAEQLRQTKSQVATMLQEANQQASDFIVKGKAEAEDERVKILAQAKTDVEQEMNRIKYTLQQETADLVVAATEKILQQKVDTVIQGKLINKLISSV